MHQLKIGTIPLPKLYVCEDRKEANQCKKLGIPYLIRPNGLDDRKLVIAVLWHTLNIKFPSIKWREVLNISSTAPDTNFYVHVPSIERTNPGIDTCGDSSPAMEMTDDGEYRYTNGGMDENDTIDFDEPVEYHDETVRDYIGDLGHYVKVEELQALKLLPVFLDDIANAIKVNLSNTMYMDGYNKKLECNMGTWQGSSQAPNLIILDVSGSIPSGVAGTMIALIDTLRHQADADLIITSGRSEYFPAHKELPSQAKLRKLVGGCNERTQFYAILRKHILGKHWGNVIIFGDNDAPTDYRLSSKDPCEPKDHVQPTDLQSTHINRILAFHTWRKLVPGYGLWAKEAAPKADIVYNNSWTSCMKDY